MANTITGSPAPKQKCFVVMGFGKKPDYATGRTLDMDATYEAIIKRAVEDAGLECIRADEIVHAGVIDKPMYEMLYSADLVVADLSTSNANAIYELGIRHALKPETTIVIAEKQFRFPFDIHSLLIRQYTHLGDGVDFREANRMYIELKTAIETLIKSLQVDSPVYTFLNDLQTPNRTSAQMANAAAVESVPLPTPQFSIETLMNLFKSAKAQKNIDWNFCTGLLNQMLQNKPEDVYLKQQLALATYKSKQPNVVAALDKAKEILQTLNHTQTTDPETLGLWGAVHKRYWEVLKEKSKLDESIWAYEKGFYLKNDFYNGINFAYLLNIRASISEKRDAIADTVIAERVRKRVIDLCNDILNPSESDCAKTTLLDDPEQKFWLQASLIEAYMGSGQKDKANELRNKLVIPDVPITGRFTPGTWAAPQWMIDSMDEQLNKLATLLEQAPTVD